MDKRLAKRHKRQVSRERAKVNISEPDVRTPEQIEAAKEASRPVSTRGDKPMVANTNRPFRSATSTGSAAKTDG